jgi:predicted RND superfamily exporter protein
VYRLTRLSLSYPKSTLLVIVVVTAILAGGLPRLRREYGYRVLIGDNHPTVETLDEFIAKFGGGLPIYIVWACGEDHPCEDVFDRTSLSMADAITRAVSSFPGVRRVSSPANAPLLVPGREGFEVRRFVEEGARVPDASALATRAVHDSLWVGKVVSTDGRVGSIIVQPVDNEAETSMRVFEAVEQALVPFEARGFEFHLVGEAPATIIGGRDLADSSGALIPFTVAVIAVILLTLSRSWQDAATTLATMGVALLWTLGLLGWLDWPRDGILEVLAPLILVIGVCDAIHLLARYAEELGSGGGLAKGEKAEGRTLALLEVARDVGLPCLITTLTTAGAFLSFVTSALATFVRFGVISAFGVSACLVLTFTLLPILARALPRVDGRVKTALIWQTALDGVVRTGQKRPLPILAITAALFVVCGFGWATRLRVDNDWLESFGEQSRAVQSVRFVEERLGPSDTLEVAITLPAEANLEDPRTLRAVDEFSQSLSAVDGLGDARSILDIVKRLNRLLHDDDPAFERFGESSAANAEILELSALSDPELLGSWVSLNRSTLRISVEATDQPYASRRAGMKSVRDSAQSLLPASWGVEFSGEYTAALEWVSDVQATQLRSFPTAFALVFVLVAILLRSVRLSLAAMVPTLLPVIATLGIMGWVGMSLDVGRAMLAAVLIGIGVDDSVHLLNQYKRYRTAGEGIREAMHHAVLHVGRAVVTTSLALSLGFLTLMASAWQTVASFGFFVSLAIMGALAASLFVLPALIFAFERGD